MTKKGVFTTGIFRNYKKSWSGLYDLSHWLILNVEENTQYCCKIRVMINDYKLYDVCITKKQDDILVKLNDQEKLVKISMFRENNKWKVFNALEEMLNNIF